jgi:sugar phosphate isomerase/epimerase
MKFGICASFHTVQHLKERHFDYLEENVQRFLLPERPQEDFEANLRAVRQLSFPIEAANSLLPPDLVLIATPERKIDTVRLESYIKTTLQRADQADLRMLVFGSGDARACPPGYAKAEAALQIQEHLATWSNWANHYGIQIVLEPLRYEETNLFNTVAESGEMISHIASSGAQLLADTYHMACNQEEPASLVPYGSLLKHIHVAEKQHRAAPGHYGEDLRPYFSALQQTGYNQRISIECNWTNIASEVNPALEALRTQWSEAQTLSLH